MPKLKLKKENEVQNLIAKIKEAKTSVVATNTKLTVADNWKFRDEIKSQGGAVQSIKKTLLKKVLVELGLDTSIVDALNDNIIVATSQDEVTAPKTTKNFGPKKDSFEIQFGIMDGVILSKEETLKLANLLSRPELLAKLVGTIYNPVSGFVRTLNAIRESRSASN